LIWNWSIDRINLNGLTLAVKSWKVTIGVFVEDGMNWLGWLGAPTHFRRKPHNWLQSKLGHEVFLCSKFKITIRLRVNISLITE
jgi:hypothetical protein